MKDAKNRIQIGMIIFMLVVALLAHVYETRAANPSFSVKQGCGPNEGKYDIYTLVYSLRGVDGLEIGIEVVDQGGNALVISDIPGGVNAGQGVLLSVYLDVDSFVTFKVYAAGMQSNTVTVYSGANPCPNVWHPSALEVQVSAPAGHCFYAHMVDSRGVWLLTDAAYPGGIIWKATDGGYVELILDPYGDPNEGSYLLTETTCPI